MAIRKRGKAFQVRLPGQRACTFPTRAAAERYELHRRVARSLGPLHEEPPITVTEMLDGFVRRWQARGRPAPATVRNVQRAAKFWRDEFGGRLLTQLALVEVD